MTPIQDSLRRLFKPVDPIPAGTYHYIAPPDDPRNYRLHLRVEPGGRGVLLVNAATVLHLNQTATEYAYYLIQNLPEDQVVNKINARYHVDKNTALAHYRDFVERIDTLVTTPDLDPVTFLDFDRQEPFTGEISAPYRLDCALTYRLPQPYPPGDAPEDRVTRELDTQEWLQILDTAWQAGIPHIVFTGGEPTLRDDLVELLAHAEGNSQVTGLLTDGLRLAEPDYLEALLQTGLDHLMILLQPEQDQAWQALKNALAADLFVAVHFTITPENYQEVPTWLGQVAELGVKTVSLTASGEAMFPYLDEAREKASLLDMELAWNLPVPYSAWNPVQLETERKEYAAGSGRAWMYVEPDGDVLPAQGLNRVLGNLLTDPWQKIWEAGQLTEQA